MAVRGWTGLELCFRSIGMEESLSPAQRNEVLGLYAETLLMEYHRMVEELEDIEKEVKGKRPPLGSESETYR